VPERLLAADRAAWICQKNIEAIRGCDLMMANVDDFRGVGEVDSGTVFEIGFAAALGKPVWAYSRDAGALIDRVPHVRSAIGATCARGFVVEDFGLSKSLMIACSATIIVGDVHACLEAIQASLQPGKPPSPCRLVGGSEIRHAG
jgi:nucleoside 2-deoxyribosyltransferase